MKVILLADVKNCGKKGAVVEVSDGYARNFLFPRKLAVDASKKSMEILSNEKKQQAQQDAQNREQALALAEKLKTMEVSFALPVGVEGKVFGSVSTKQVVAQFEKDFCIKLDKRKIKDTAPIGHLGLSKIEIELYKGVPAHLQIRIVEKKA